MVLHTDSPVTPQVPLQLRMIGADRPPFLVAARGNLNYPPGFSPDEARNIQVTTVERQEASARPRLECDLPFLQFEFDSVTEEPYPDPGAVERTYLFRVTFRSPPPAGTFAGEVEAIDPWDGRLTKRIPVHGRVSTPIRDIPPSLTLHVADPPARAVLARFSVIASEPISGIEVEAEQGAACPLLVERRGLDLTGRFATFEVRWRPDRPLAEGAYCLVVRPTPEALGRTIVPINVRFGGD